MNIYTDLSKIPELSNPVITIGTFDGVHLGHQEILRLLSVKKEEVKGESVVLTFHPHPRMVLYPNDHHLELIQTIDERVEKLAEFGVDHLIIFPFSKKFSQLSAIEFVRDILVNKLGLHTLIIGYDHHFGKNREGSMENLKELAPLFEFNICEIEAFSKLETNISSTKIRNAVKALDFVKVTSFLGSPFRLSGVVVRGDKIGSALGYPTANINVSEDYKLIPPGGVYAVKVLIGDIIYDGMLNIGQRPTVSDSGELRIEVHILSFKDNIYDQEIKIDIIEYIREEANFENKMELINQIMEDEKHCRSILHSYH